MLFDDPRGKNPFKIKIRISCSDLSTTNPCTYTLCVRRTTNIFVQLGQAINSLQIYYNNLPFLCQPKPSKWQPLSKLYTEQKPSEYILFFATVKPQPSFICIKGNLYVPTYTEKYTYLAVRNDYSFLLPLVTSGQKMEKQTNMSDILFNGTCIT